MFRRRRIDIMPPMRSTFALVAAAWVVLAGTAAADSTPPPAAAPDGPRPHVLGCPARDETDELALRMFRGLLDPAKWDLDILPVTALAAELVERVAATRPAAVVLAALPPGGLAHTRHLCKRLRARLPGAKIVVGRWGLRGNVEQNQDELQDAGADQVATTLLEARDLLNSWLPVLAQEGAKAAG